MKTKLIVTTVTLALTAGCAAPGYQPYGQYPSAPPQYSSTPQPAPQQVAYAGGAAPCQAVNPGHIIGGIAGAIIGAQVGNGNGRTAAAAIGAATGAIAGGAVGRDPNCR